MEKEVADLAPDVQDVLDLGVILGNNQAFGLVAGRCSAAQAAGLGRLRDEGKYKAVTPRWRDFCTRYLRISGAEADRIIRLWKEFGAGYFELAQLTRVSPELYRAIAPSIQDGALHSNGEIIELNLENSRRLAAAVEVQRQKARTSKSARPLERHERIAELGKRATAFVADFEDLAVKERSGENWLQLMAILSRVSAALGRLELASGLK